MEKETDEQDIIDVELSKRLDSLLEVEESDDEDAFNEAEDILYSVIGDLVDEGTIPEIPEPEVPEDEKKEWLELYLPIIDQAIEAELESVGPDEDDDSDEESEEDEEPEEEESE